MKNPMCGTQTQNMAWKAQTPVPVPPALGSGLWVGAPMSPCARPRTSPAGAGWDDSAG